MDIHQITFSPTGGTRRVSAALCSGFDAQGLITELCVPAVEVCYPHIAADDLVVISMPVYAGRVPALAVERLKHVESHGAQCVIVAVYGNRAYEDALVELQDVATAMGFCVIAAVSAVAEHSICWMYGAGRPDADDTVQLASFGAAIMAKATQAAAFGQLSLPGNRPYRQGCTGPFPMVDERCVGCGACAAQCPTGAISTDHPQTCDQSLCIGCMRCVQLCPTHARGIGERLAMLTAHLEPLCRERKSNEIYL